MREYQQHELSAAFPGMSKPEFAALVEDLAENGQREPAVRFEGKILDGWHRVRGCQACGRVPIIVDLPPGIEPVAFVLSRNLHRRHLTGLQRAAAVVACREWAGAGKPANLDMVSTLADMARDAEVSTKTVQRAKAAHTAGLGEAVRAGVITAKDTAVFARVPREWVDGLGGDRFIESCAAFEVTMQLAWDTFVVMAIWPELGLKIRRGEIETEEAKAFVMKHDLDLARRAWSGELELSLAAFDRLREESEKDLSWLTEEVAAKLVERTLLEEVADGEAEAAKGPH